MPPLKGLNNRTERNEKPMRIGRYNLTKRAVWLCCSALMLVLALVCALMLVALAHRLDSQRVAEYWRGESGESFSQVSCFIPATSSVTRSEIYGFRYKVLEALRVSGQAADGTDGLWVDAWSREGKVKLTSSRASTDASAIAVGGDYFTFHRLHLLSGSYFRESDLMKDKVLLDEEMAWLLFGGTELEGMAIRINGQSFLVGGVVEREQDAESRRAYTAGAGVYMSYDAYITLTGDDRVDCYELVMAESVDGYTRQTAEASFPLKGGEVVVNTGRYSLPRTIAHIPQLSDRAIQSNGIRYPYWENAARIVEDRCAILLIAVAVLLLPPLITGIVYLVRLFRYGREALVEELMPQVVGHVGEAVRVRRRRRWERRQGRHGR